MGAHASLRAGLALGMTAILAMTSCGTEGPPVPNMADSQSQEFKAIVIRTAPYRYTALDIDEPTKGFGSGAASGAGKGAGAVLGGCAQGADPILFVFCLALVPVGAVTGALVGAGSARSSEAVEEATTSLQTAFAEAKPDAGLERALVERIRGIGDGKYSVRALTESEKRLPDSELAKRGIEAVLDLDVRQLDLAVYGDIAPDSAISITAQASVRDTAGEVAPVPLSWSYLGERHGFFELAADNAALLRDLLDRSYDEIGKMISADFFNKKS